MAERTTINTRRFDCPRMHRSPAVSQVYVSQDSLYAQFGTLPRAVRITIEAVEPTDAEWRAWESELMDRRALKARGKDRDLP